MTQAELQVHGVENRLRKAGLRWVGALHAAMQSCKLYPDGNSTVAAAIGELDAISRDLLRDEGTLELRIANGCVFVNHARMPMNLASFGMFGTIERTLARFELHAIEVRDGVRRSDWAALSRILVLPTRDGGFAQLDAALKAAGVDHVRLVREAKTIASAERGEQAKRVYLRSVQVAREMLTSMRMGQAVNVRGVKRSVQAIVDQVLTNQAALLGMTTMRDFDEYTFRHSVNVCILCIVFGQKLGFDKKNLYEIGLCGLFHDLGKMRIDWRVINKAGKLTDAEWNAMRLHPAEGLLSLFEIHGLATPPFRQMLAAYEHHMRIDLSGYPVVRRPRTPTLFSRIVSVVDTFDAVTSVRSYRSRPWPPDKVLRNMRDESDWGLDRVLVKAFINATGIYPVGTVVQLSTQCLGVVVEQNAERPHTPVVRVVTDATGAMLADPRTVDLADPASAADGPLTIVRSMDAESSGIDPSRFLVPA